MKSKSLTAKSYVRCPTSSEAGDRRIAKAVLDSLKSCDTNVSMTDKQIIKYLQRQCRSLNKERKLLRRIVDSAANCISDSARGHSPNWRAVMDKIDAYEDAYSPAGDPE